MNLYSTQKDEVPPAPGGSGTHELSKPSFSRLDMTGLISHSATPADTTLDREESSTSLGDSAGRTPLITKRKVTRVAPPQKPTVDAESMTESQRSEIEWTYGATYPSKQAANKKKKKKKKKKPSKNKSSSKRTTVGEDEDFTESSTEEDDLEHGSNGIDYIESADHQMVNKRQTNAMTVNSSIVIKYDNDEERPPELEDDERLEDLKVDDMDQPEKEGSDYFEIEVGPSSRVSSLGLDVRMSALIDTRESAYNIAPFQKTPRYSRASSSRNTNLGDGAFEIFEMDEIEEEEESGSIRPMSKKRIQPMSPPKPKVKKFAKRQDPRSTIKPRATPKTTTEKKKAPIQPKSNRNPLILIAVVVCVLIIVALTLWLLNDQGILSWWQQETSPAGSTGEQPQISVVDISVLVKGAIATEFGAATALSLEDPSSPQTKAAKWIDEVDIMFSFPLSSGESKAFKQRYALATFYFATLGPDFWYNDINFLSELHECDWNEGALGVTCNNDLDVSDIHFVLNGLRGSIPAELGELGALEAIVLDGNRISGSLPNRLYQLTNLVKLSIPYSQLTGSLSTMIGNLSNLEDLRIEGAFMDGSIPSELRMLTNLKRLLMRDNSLSGAIPREVANLPSLEELNLSFNKLTAKIPSGAYGALQEFAVAGNQLTGSFPTSVFGTRLRVLTLHENSLIGRLPDVAWNLARALTTVDISNNSFRGTIPDSIGSLLDLNTFIAKNVGLSGKLPDDLDNTSLEVLDLEGNSLTGTVPMSYASLPLCKFVNASMLCWKIPNFVPISTHVQYALQLVEIFCRETSPSCVRYAAWIRFQPTVLTR